MDLNDNETLSSTKNIQICICMFCATVISFGLLIGWGVSMFTTCGMFDVDRYTLNVMQSHNCTVPYITPYCADIYHDTRRLANDLALQQCFVYCWDGMIYGAILASVSLLIVICANYYMMKKKNSVIYEARTHIQPHITLEHETQRFEPDTRYFEFEEKY